MRDTYDPKLAKSVACPKCGALAGQPCRSRFNIPQVNVHRARLQEYNKETLVDKRKL